MEENGKGASKEIIPSYKSVQQFTQEGFKVLMEAIRSSNALPQDRNFHYYKTHSSFRKLMNDEGSSILQMINTIVKDQGVSGNFASRDLDEKIEVIVEANDAILERAATNLDEVNGIRKNPDLNLKIQEVSVNLPVSGSWNKMENMNMKVSSFQPESGNAPINSASAIRLITANNIQRPQKFFKDRIDNSNNYPWEPKIKEKPNSIKPLAIFLEENEDGTQSYSHPYEFELDKFEPSADLLTKINPKMPKVLEETPLKLVENQDQLNEMLQDLFKYNEIAVDLEHHSYRTFLGITCLMQISTGDTDYIIDTLSLRDKLWVLNEVFTKPTILKVFHGADHDIEWLQRDLSLYIVNMFDTYQAAKQLNFEHRSLAFLLRRYCGIDVNKHFQLADWRIRPLPDELKLYAREDTHYLLYIYHIVRNELIKQGNGNPHILKSVIDQSTNICKIRFEKPFLTENSHMLLYRKFKKLFDNRQMYALKELYKWRDNIARIEDESTGYVLPNHMLLQIADMLPREMQGILACCNPIPQLVRANLLEIHKIILKGREQPLVKPILSEEPRTLGSVQSVTRLNVDNALNCPHDVSGLEFREDLPTLLGELLRQKKATNENNTETIINTTVVVNMNQKVLLESSQPYIDIFDKIEESIRTLEQEANKKIKKPKFLGPFERYKLVKPYMQAEEEKKEDFLAKEKIVENNEIVEARTVPELPKTVDNQKSASNKVVEVPKDRNGTSRTETITSSSEAVPSGSEMYSQEGETSRKVIEYGKSFQIQISNKSGGQDGSSNKKQPDIPLRQMIGCKRKRSPTPDKCSEEEEGYLDPEGDLPMEDRVAPLLDVTPHQSGWTPEKYARGKRQKNKQGGNPSKKQKNDGLHQKNATDQYLFENDGFYNLVKRSLPGEKNEGSRILKAMRKKHYKAHDIEKPEGDQRAQNWKNARNKKKKGKTKQNQQNNQQKTNQNKKGSSNRHNQNRQNRNQNQLNNQHKPQNFNNQNRNNYSHQNIHHQQQDQQNQPNTSTNRQNNYQPFDYSSVDFRQFQGGAGGIGRGGNVRSNFRGKNKSKIRGRGVGKGNNRSSFFGMGGNRGRGR